VSAESPDPPALAPELLARHDSAGPAPELLARHDSAGPRYTSYPTALELRPGFTEAHYLAALTRADALGEAPLSVYTHLPFCERRCAFCGCHSFATTRRQVAEPYLEHVVREMELVAARLPNRRKVVQYHLGGGTPTYFAPNQLDRLVGSFARLFQLLPGAELAVEVDPRVTTPAHLDTLAALGFRRISFGVQDFSPEVQAAIGRGQTREQTVVLVERARRQGFSGINFDLVYGLPGQSLESFRHTLAETVALRPDRVAVYSFAYLPAIRGNQKAIAAAAVPGRDTRFALLTQARAAFLDAGYQAIGMDHFALPGDELALAQRQGRLSRNFMGYAVTPGEDALGFGVSAIGDVRGALVQNEKMLAPYYRALDAGRLPVQRGYQRSADDEIRRQAIQSLLCNFVIDRAAMEARHGIVFDDYFRDALDGLRPFVADGMCRVDERGVHAVGLGQLLVRNLAMCFDAYLVTRQRLGRPVFSRTV
jgi:oxygen-independent coproporphyrinogen-3 oxidase